MRIPGRWREFFRAVTDALRAVVTGSLEATSDDKIQLVGDSLAPGPLKYYGTDVDGRKGFHQFVQTLKWQGQVLDRHISEPPTDPQFEDGYCIPPGATGVWAGHDHEIAQWDGNEWYFAIPYEGYYIWVVDEDCFYAFDSLIWRKLGTFIDHSNLFGLEADDHEQYAHIDGRRGFTNPISGQDPINRDHLTTKGFVDDKIIFDPDLKVLWLEEKDE